MTEPIAAGDAAVFDIETSSRRIEGEVARSIRTIADPRTKQVVGNTIRRRLRAEVEAVIGDRDLALKVMQGDDVPAADRYKR